MAKQGGNEPLSCNIKAPIHVRLGDHSIDFHSGCSVIDVTFNTPHVEIGELQFRNHHTAWLRVQVQIKENNNGELKWRTAVNCFTMMPQPHFDLGGEALYTINKKHMNFDLQNIAGLRFVLHQPSPIWKEFKIDDVVVYRKPSTYKQEASLPKWLGEEREDLTSNKLNGVSSLSTMCNALQQMWALTDNALQHQATSNLGRYDIDGSYEINMLSYT